MMPADASERANRWPWPPILYGIFGVGLLGLEWVSPSPPVGGEWLLRPLGIVIFSAGLLFGLWAIATFLQIGTTIEPTGRASQLAATGPYRFSRNPMYVAAVAGFFGLGLIFGSLWTLAGVPFLALFLQRLAILPEETHLTARFGEDYRRYCQRVRRWL